MMESGNWDAQAHSAPRAFASTLLPESIFPFHTLDFILLPVTVILGELYSPLEFSHPLAAPKGVVSDVLATFLAGRTMKSAQCIFCTPGVRS